MSFPCVFTPNTLSLNFMSSSCHKLPQLKYWFNPWSTQLIWPWMNLSTNLTICPAAVVSASHDYQPLPWSYEQDCVVMLEVHGTRTAYWWGEKHESQLGVCMGLSCLNDCGWCWRWLYSYQNLVFILHFCADIVICVLKVPAVTFVWQYDRCSRFSRNHFIPGFNDRCDVQLIKL